MTFEERQRIGRLGGKATAAKYGSEYMSALGKKGFQAVVELRGFSDPGAFIAWAIKNGKMPKKRG